tara:strand:+ start:5991 stop:7343 length:1353 start_codon:yes stop_codon:yes gene_type:complete
MKYKSTRNNQEIYTSEQVLNYGLSPDGGLFVPESLPSFTQDQIKSLKGLSYYEIANFILRPFLTDLFSDIEINEIIGEAYKNFDDGIVSVSSIGENQLLNLFHGPTLAFKDYAMCLLAKIYEYYLKKKNQELVIVGATSGDTGSAAIHAFKGIQNIKIFILHPHNSTSLFQRKQMTTSGANNVFNVALNGSFDDCQSLVKKSFNDQNLNQYLNLTAVNSINWFRVLPQSIYYAWCYLNHNTENFVVPSGNFGNIYSAFLLRKMGFPLRELVVATNENNILHRVIKNNDLKLMKVVKTNSPSMDITISSNFERLLGEFINPNELNDLYQKMANNDHFQSLDSKIHMQLSNNFQSMSANSQEVEEQIKKIYNNFNILIDPHTAVGVSCAEKLNMKNAMCLACAHPVKFQETVKHSLKQEIKYNKNLKFDRDEDFTVLDNNYTLLKEYIQNHA